MNRSDLQRLCRIRLREARTLFRNGCFEGAYYLSGYAVECALKACIARKVRQFDFPDRRLVHESYTHDLAKLVSVSGLQGPLHAEMRTNRDLELNWGIVKDWSEEARYWDTISRTRARELYSAIAGRRNGVLTWLKKWW
jgi:hypothetical protein